MAIWQYDLLIIPIEDLLIIGSDNPINEQIYDNFEFWKQSDYQVNFFEKLIKPLPSGKSWSNTILLYGHEESNCIKLIVEKEKVIEVIFRLDYQTNFIPILNNVIEFCLLNSMAIIDDELNVLELNTTTILQHIKNSNRFLKWGELNR